MRSTITVDDILFATAQEYTDLIGKSAIDAALKALVEHGAARRLANRGGSEPDLRRVTR